MRVFAQLMQGYRSCLTLIRINPKPVIEFHKAAFLGSRELSDSTDFIARVLDSMFFTTFVTERGPPWRSYDAWDELYNAMSEHLKTEQQDRRLIIKHIQELAQKLYINENPSIQNYQQKILTPPEGAFSRIHQPDFPTIDPQKVQMIINEGILKNDFHSRLTSNRNNTRIVPIGPLLPSYNDGRHMINLTHTVRKMEVIKNCLNCIFENKISDARKIFPAVLRILKQRDDARLFLCRELSRFIQGSSKATLEHPQFDLICKLMNRALQDDSPKFQHDIAASLLPLSVSFCRKLSSTAIQFAYSCIQDHPIWKTQMFWEQAFYQEVQANIKNLYVSKPSDRNSFMMSESMHSTAYDIRVSQELSALEIAAKQMMDWPSFDSDKQNDLINSEEQILYSQALHYANRMISLLIPMDVRSNTKVKKRFPKPLDDDVSISNSVLESRSDQSNEGYEERDANELEQNVVRQVCKFVDKVCNEGGVTADHIRKLHSIIPGLVDMQCETLDCVYRESKRIPPVQKPKIQFPALLSGEEFIGDPIRTVLQCDGREEVQCGPLVPAEGALFLTNYRIIFKGMPIDSLSCEQSVIRSFPIASMTKEKRISGILSNDQVLADGLQLRSCTFQLIKVAFDEEVNQNEVEVFRKALNRARHPDDEFGFFAFAHHNLVMKPQNPKAKEKNATLRGFAKKTLLKTARKAGFKYNKSTTKRKYIFSDIESFHGNSTTLNNNNNNNESDEEDDQSEDESMPRVTVKDVEKLKERSYVKDWMRLNLTTNGFRISTLNCNYSVCRTYPAVIICPKTISDEQLKSLSKTYKSQRIPVPTWRHSTNNSVLLRGSLSLAKGVMGMLKSANSSANASMEGKVDSLQDQDRFFCSIIPNHMGNVLPSESSISMDSLINSRMQYSTPMSNRRNENVRLNNSNAKVNKWESLKRNAGGLKEFNNYDDSYSISHHGRQGQRTVPLYFLGERSQSKSIRLSELGVEYIPVYYNDNRHSREAFKKLMRACLPSATDNEPDHTFAKLIEQSDWLQQIRSLLQLSGTIVDLLDLHEASVNLSFEGNSLETI